MAVTLTLVFMHINGKWLEIHPNKLYELATSVAQSSPANRDKVIQLIKAVFNKFVVNS